MSTIDTDEFRTLLEAGARTADQRGRVPARREPREHRGRARRGRGAAARTTTSGDTASATFDRELDEGLEEGAQQTLVEIDAALAAHRGRDATGSARCAASRSARSACARSRGRELCIDDQRRARVSEPERSPSASARDERARARLRRRALARRRGLAVGRPRRGRGRGGDRRPGDEARRHAHARARRLGARRRAAVDPPRAELRHRLRPLLERDRRSSRS